VLINHTQAVRERSATRTSLSANDTTREALAAQSERAVKLQQALELSDPATAPAIRRISKCSRFSWLQAQTLQIIAARGMRLSLVDFASRRRRIEYKTACNAVVATAP
jgi:hypothetical protein